MRSKLKTFFAIAGVLVVVTAISLITVSRKPLYGQAGDDNWVPNLMGTWRGEAVAYSYQDVTNSLDIPVYGAGFLGDIVITPQNGRVFAGTWIDYLGNNIKIAGVILPDRTVSIQDFTPSEERNFFTGRLTISGGTLQISGYLHSFDDFHHTHFFPGRKESDKTMASLYVRLTKVN